MYKIRYAKVEDAKILGEIHSQSWKVAYKDIILDEILNNITAEKREGYFERALSKQWEEDALIFIEDKAVGLICIGKCRDEDIDSSYGEIWGIYLLPEFWNKGIGYELIKWGMKELKDRNYKRITIWVLEENLKARRFYEQVGFKHDGTIKEIIIGESLNEYRYAIDILDE